MPDSLSNCQHGRVYPYVHPYSALIYMGVWGKWEIASSKHLPQPLVNAFPGDAVCRRLYKSSFPHLWAPWQHSNVGDVCYQFLRQPLLWYSTRLFEHHLPHSEVLPPLVILPHFYHDTLLSVCDQSQVMHGKNDKVKIVLLLIFITSISAVYFVWGFVLFGFCYFSAI